MKAVIVRLTLGLALAGCTINSTRVSVDYSAPAIPTDVTSVTPAKQPVVINKEPDISAESTQPIEKIIVVCKPYRPLPVPEPIRIDLEEIRATKSNLELNAVLLRNVKQLHGQLKDYKKQSDKHYKDYVHKCAGK